MNKVEERHFRHLQIVERSVLLSKLVDTKHFSSLQDIAKDLGVSRQTLYREILRNSTIVRHDSSSNRLSCSHYKECHKGISSHYFSCSLDCPQYEEFICPLLKKYPFICDTCKKRARCYFIQRFYNPENAQASYRKELKFSRSSLRTKKSTMLSIDKIVSPLVQQGQSIDAILMSHPEISIAPSTIRTWIKKGYLHCSYSQLRMTGRRKISIAYNYSKNKEHVKLSSRKIGHKYPDYLFYVRHHPNALIVQLDSLIGSLFGNKTILTIHLVQYHFQFGILLQNHSSHFEVLSKLKELLSQLEEIDLRSGSHISSRFKEVLLCDNGIEFDSMLELDDSESCHVFFCHPNSSYEKGHCERNHVLFRYIRYKGHNFDSFSQDTVNMLFSHINSYPRKSIAENTPYSLVLNDLGIEFLNTIGIYYVNPDEINLTPSLLKK